MAKATRAATKTYSNITEEFAPMITVDSYINTVEERRIYAGESFLIVWREYYCKSKDDVANAMDVDIFDYILMEEGEFVPNEIDIVNFCRFLCIHPCQLLGKPPHDLSIIKALLMVNDDPALLSPYCKISEDMARQILLAEATEAYYNLHNMQKLLGLYPELHVLTMKFIDYLLENDGTLVFDGDEDIFDHSKVFLDGGDDELNWVNEQIDYYAREYKKHTEFYNIFGNRVHPDQWISTARKINKLIQKTSLDEALDTYLNDPSLMGRTHFPELSSPMLIKMINGDQKTFSWRAAQRKLAQHIETLYMAENERKKFEKDAAQINDYCAYFKAWIDNNHNLLARFENRQIILQDPSFQAQAKTVAPKPNGLWAVTQLHLTAKTPRL